MIRHHLEKIELSQWNVYFLLKFFLFWNDYINLHALPNLAFALFLLLPTEVIWLRYLKQMVAIPVGISLFYYDTWLPSVDRLWSEANLVESFNTEYLVELAQRFISIDFIALIFAVWLAYALIGHFIRVGVLVVIYLLIASLPLKSWFVGDSGILLTEQNQNLYSNQVHSQQPQSLNDYLSAFYQNEKSRFINFKKPKQGDVPFDVLYLHVCSFSWDDLDYTKQKNDLPAFDVILENFNSAASYSGPAAIRILRAGCGQTKHDDLYKNTQQQCYLFDDLKALGFESELAMNHDGHFDDFLGVIQRQGGMNDVTPLTLKDFKAPLKSFDGTPIYSDLDVLERWFEQRQNNPATRVATLYNTISLHDGNRYTDSRSQINSTKNFNSRMNDFLSDLKQFFKQLEASQRRILVVLIPEHGAAIRGDKIQISGLREIPSPAITHVPVGLRLFGPEITPPLNPIRVSQSTSLFDVNSIVAKIIALNPFAKAGDYQPKELVSNLRGTAFVSENAGTVVMRHQGKYFIRLNGSNEWSEYPTEASK